MMLLLCTTLPTQDTKLKFLCKLAFVSFSHYYVTLLTQ